MAQNRLTAIVSDETIAAVAEFSLENFSADFDRTVEHLLVIGMGASLLSAAGTVTDTAPAKPATAKKAGKK